MKHNLLKNKLTILLLTIFITPIILSQDLETFDDFGEKRLFHDEYLFEKEIYIFDFKPSNPCNCLENYKFWGDAGFGGSNFTAINAGLMREARLQNALNDWYDKQRELIQEQIEEYYKQKFNNYTEAVNKAFVGYGKSDYKGFDSGLNRLKLNNNNISKQYKARNTVNIRELNHLNYRKQEILNGNINNSIFSFSEIHGGTLLKDIKDINGINTNWNIIKGFLDTNLPTEQNAQNYNEELGNLDVKFDNFMLDKQRKFYYDYLNPGQRLFLEQFTINILKAYKANPNAFRPPNGLNFNLSDDLATVRYMPFGNEEILQNYLWKYSKKSVFDPKYYLTVLDEILVNNGFQAVYGDLNKINFLYRVTYLVAAKSIANQRRYKAFNELINAATTEEILIDLAITALGERNNAFLDARPKLREEVEEYFKANNRSKFSHDGINWTLNQFQDNNEFPVNPDLFKSTNAPLFQDTNNPNRAIKIEFNQQGITEGITNFGNVLAELLRDNSHPSFEGSLIRTIFKINNLNISNEIIDPLLGSYYRFIVNDGSFLEIGYEGDLGSYLFNLGIYNNDFLNLLGLSEAEMFLNHLKTFQNTPIEFSNLWDNFEDIKGTHVIDDNENDFSNYCAINLSHALLNTGVNINKFDGAKCWGCKNIKNKSKHVIRAQELADWLKTNGSNITGVEKPVFLTGNNFETFIDGKKGIVFFKDYWKRSTDSGTNRTGDHIDLWDGNELAGSTWIGTRFRLIFPWIAERFGTSDLRKSKEVIFWEIKK